MYIGEKMILWLHTDMELHCVKRVVIQYCITRVFMCYAHVIHVLSACV